MKRFGRCECNPCEHPCAHIELEATISGLRTSLLTAAETILVASTRVKELEQIIADTANTRISPDGARRCRACEAANRTRRIAARAALQGGGK